MLYNCSGEPLPRSLTVGVIDYYVQHYIFPVQFILGVVGNSINLLVLLSTGMKNQTNTLLSAMAFADLGFLLCMLPHSLVSFSMFYTSVRFSYFYFLIKTHAVALANMFSTAATFLVLAVSLERFSGVRRPMHTRLQLRDTRLMLLIVAIFTFAFILTFFHHVEYNVSIIIGCSTVWANFQHISQLYNTSSGLVIYVRYARYVQSIVGVFIPVIAVAVLNVSLIYFLRRREMIPRSGTLKGQQEFRRYSRSSSDIGTFQRQERKVTLTVIAIVSCFSLTHLPTLGPFIWEQIYSYRGMKPTSTFNNVITLLNMLLVSGKTLNFVLFCSSSAHFRRRTIMILNAHLCQGRYRKKYSSMVTSTVPVGGALSTGMVSLTMPVPNTTGIISNHSTTDLSMSNDYNHQLNHRQPNSFRPRRHVRLHNDSTASLRVALSSPPGIPPQIPKSSLA
ncbi:7 transmembrane receptor (rhodopsin family) domain-containing protein [Ditylenchus destructor]|nr:7 transmembrane receptor (rhodopsin family) domain-containing protein [Ditylenchus destructor]